MKKTDIIINIISYFFFFSIIYIVNEWIHVDGTYFLFEKTGYFSLKHQIYNFFIYFSLFLILNGLINKFFLTNWIFVVFYMIITIISGLKNAMSTAPLYLSDINYLKYGIGNITSLIPTKTLLNSIKGLLIKYLIILVFLIIFTIIFKKQTNIKLNKKNRIISIISSFIMLTVLLNPFIFEKINNYNEFEFRKTNLYSQYGFFTGIYSCHLMEQIKEPDNYNEKIVVDILENYKSNETVESWGKPNVIVILSEAFFDITSIEDLKFNKDILENYNYVKENSKTFYLETPVYAGRTGNVEFEFYNMFTLRYLPNFFVPFNVLYKRESMSNYYSVPTILNEEYTTTIYSPFDDGEVYNVKNSYDMIKFENKWLYSDLCTRANKKLEKGIRFVSDENLFNFIKEDLSNEKEQPLFTFVKTVQNHMPYNYYRYYSYNEKDQKYYDLLEIKAENIIENKYSEAELSMFSIYSQGFYDNTKALKDFYDYVMELEEPTVVIFFGDHLPNMYNDSLRLDVLDKTNLFQSEDELTNLYNKYTTEGLIFANYDINTNDLVSNLSINVLSSYILKHLDVDKGETSGYIDYLYDSMFILPACNKYFNINNGILKSSKEFTEKELEIYNNINYIQYYFLKKYYKK